MHHFNVFFKTWSTGRNILNSGERTNLESLGEFPLVHAGIENQLWCDVRCSLGNFLFGNVLGARINLGDKVGFYCGYLVLIQRVPRKFRYVGRQLLDVRPKKCVKKKCFCMIGLPMLLHTKRNR